MDVKRVAEDCIRLVGGKENVKSVFHCATRLRFRLADKELADIEGLNALDEVITVKEVGDQTQVVIGPSVSEVYKEVVKVTGTSEPDDKSVEQAENQGKEKNRSARILDMVSGIFAPIIPVITGAGMVKALLTIMVMLGLPNTSHEYYILNFIADSGFYFFPVVLGFSSAMKFGCNPYLAAMIGGVLIHPKWMELVAAGGAVTFLGLPVKMIGYSSTVLPIILTVWFMSYVERFADKYSPNAMKYILRPLITLIVTSVVSLIVLGPLGSYIGGILVAGISFLDTHTPILVPTIVGATLPFLIFFGVHIAIFPPLHTIQLAELGYETVTGPGFLAANIAAAGATLGVAFRSRDKKVKELAFSAGITALCGITEPAIYGTIIKFKRAIFATVFGGMCGGLFAGIVHLKRYALALPGIPALPTFIGENSNNIIYAVITVVISFIVSFATVMVIGIDESEKTEKKTAKKAEKELVDREPLTIYAPLEGKVIPLEQIPDKTFASGALGAGVGIEPVSNVVCAPFDGTIILTTDTKHAIGIRSDDGIELMIHVGVDTVEMAGEGFELHCSQDDHVQCGQPLLTFDADAVKKAGHPTVTAVLVMNGVQFSEIRNDKFGDVTMSEKMLTAVK